MGAELADYGPKPTVAEAAEQRKAAVRIAAQLGIRPDQISRGNQ
ncbi:hypothetical protein GCM10010317_077860 [Streptomyces mirabilis]|nr:hypothetical protein [Streptomyces mirabilis]GHD70483.1 hypothetical protein GCM10010317_077860 [Streptomyces mirabilis]